MQVFNCIGKALSGISTFSGIPQLYTACKTRSIELYESINSLSTSAYNLSISLAKKITLPPLNRWNATNLYNYLFKNK